VGWTGGQLFGISEIRVIIFLTVLLLIGGAVVIYQKSSAEIGPEVIIERIESTRQNNDITTPHRDFLRSMLSKNRININTAPADSLEILPGIGPALAIRIVEYRNTYGNFDSIRDIIEVRGIGPATFGELKDLISTE